MIVECPSCKTTYNVENEKVKPEGTKARCTVCKHVFVIEPGDAQDDLVLDAVFPEESPQEAPQEAPGESSFEDALAQEAAPGAEQETPTAEGDVDAAITEEEPSAYSFDLDGAAAKEKKKKSIWPILVVILLLLLLLIPAGLWYAAPGYLPPSINNMISSILGESPSKPEIAEEGFITLKNIRQYFVENTKTGSIFVLEGMVVNEYNTPKEGIVVQADLFDESGEVLDSVRITCGNSLDLVQLQSLGKEEITAALNNEAGIMANNTDLQPGDDTPFMAVFFDPPENIIEFRIEVVEFKNPES